MNLKIKIVSLASGLLFGTVMQGAGQGTAFTYQGAMTEGAKPATGTFDFQFALYTTGLRGGQIGSTVTNLAVGVTNGFFTTTLDFGPGIFTGPALWLQLAVRTNGGGAYTQLSALQPLLAAPYAIMANTASNLLGPLPAGQLAGGYTNPVAFGNPGNSFTGTFIGDGSGLVNISVDQLTGVEPLLATVVTNFSAPTFKSIVVTNSTGLPFFTGNGTWFTSPVPYIEPVMPNQDGILDVASSGTSQPSWVDIGNGYNLSTNGQWLSLSSIPSQYVDVVGKGLGTNAGVPLILQGDPSRNSGAIGSQVGFFNYPDDAVSVMLNEAGATGLDVVNYAVSSAAVARIMVKNAGTNSTTGLELDSFATTWVPAGAYQPNGQAVQSHSPGGLSIVSLNSNASTRFYVGGSGATNGILNMSNNVAAFMVPVLTPVLTATNGIASRANVSKVVSSTGWTNNLGVTAAVTLTAATSAQEYSATGSMEWSISSLKTPFQFRVQPGGWLIGIALTGTANAW
jgi:hypothetical protein